MATLASTNQLVIAQASPGQRPNLGRIGNTVRDQLDSSIEKDLFEHFWLGRGTTVQLTAAQFGRAAADVAGRVPSSTQTFALGTQILYRAQFAFPPSEFDAAFGTASVFYDSQGQPVGFYDLYNFDIRLRGRSVTAAGNVLGVRVACAIAGNCTDFEITFGQFIRP